MPKFELKLRIFSKLNSSKDIKFLIFCQRQKLRNYFCVRTEILKLEIIWELKLELELKLFSEAEPK